ncbi:MAG: anhydro-N-acetylmuramic acid kinase [Ignavibacteriaceae bacterium]|nr:anhydro-N-acetylmuramic acid kinase [Ignavibacteriaceae bacterium]
MFLQSTGIFNYYVDFRVGDVAFDGQGAPLVPYFDLFFIAQIKRIEHY